MFNIQVPLAKAKVAKAKVTCRGSRLDKNNGNANTDHTVIMNCGIIMEIFMRQSL
jgi:hypothetical protein